MLKRVLITGASGLLGRAVLKEFLSDVSWTTLGVAFSRAKDLLKKVDLTQSDQVQNLFEDFKPSVIIHCAAERRPDVVENQQDATRKINVDATKLLCEQASIYGAHVLYISTDYVFDGTNPPYQVDDKPNPLNKYGQSKLDGEAIVLSSNPGNMVLRLPILYGEIENLDESAVTILFSKVKDTTNKCIMSDYERRYPTNCADIACVIRQLLEKRIQDASLTGIFHWSGDENMTKYDMAVTMANVFGLPTDHILAESNPSGGTKRPYDAHLDPKRIEQLGICHRTPFKDGIQECLKNHAS